MKKSAPESYLSIIDLAGAEQGIQRIIARHQKAGEVDQKGTADIEEDQKGVEAEQSEDYIDLGDSRLLLKIVKGRPFRQLATHQHQSSFDQDQELNRNRYG